VCSCVTICDLLEDCYGIAITSWSYLMKIQRQKKFTSIVQKVFSRSITGQGLGLGIHAHRGLTIHLSWNPGACEGSFQNCIARYTVQSAVWRTIIRQVRRRGLSGTCKCVYDTIVKCEDNSGLERGIVQAICSYTIYKGVWYNCRCNISFSLEIGEHYRTSMFLTDGCMMLFEAAHLALKEC
jgi:hypothetical protein